MSDPVNVRELAVGTRVMLASGAEVEIVSNPRDGVWVFGRYLSADGDAAGEEGDDFPCGIMAGAGVNGWRNDGKNDVPRVI